MEPKCLESESKGVEPLAVESEGKVESDEVLSGSESAEMTEEKTDSSDRGTGTDEKLSPVASESTSGIGTKSDSLKSPESAEAATKEKAPPVLPVEAAGVTVQPTLPDEGAVGEVDSGSPDIPAEKAEVGSEVSPPEKCKKRGSLVRGAMAIFKKSPHKKESSPTEKTGVLSRFRLSKSVGSPEKPQELPTEKSRTLERETGCATPEEEEAFKKGAEKKPVLKRLAKSISSVFKHKSGSVGETEGLVTDQDNPVRTPVAGSPVKANDQITPEEEEIIKRIYWTEGRQSLTERPSLTTEMTDLPSTFTGADAFKPGDSRRASEVGENTSEEAVAGSLASSLGDIKEIASDKDEKSVSSTSADNEGEPKVDPECKEGADTAVADEKQESKENAEVVADEKPASKENAEVGDKKPESKETLEENAEVVADETPESQENAKALEAEKSDAKDSTMDKEVSETSELKEAELEKPADADKTE